MTTNTTRRRVLAGMAGGVAATATGTAVAALPVLSADADFFALYREYRAANAEFDAVLDALQRAEEALNASPDPLRQEALDRAHAAEERTCHRDWELFMRVGAAPVHTLEGVRVKLQVLATWLRDNMKGEIEPPFVDTALEAVERLAAGGAA